MTSSPPAWRLNFKLPFSIISAVEEMLGESADVSTKFELDEAKKIWELSFYFNNKPDESHLKLQLSILNEMFESFDGNYTLEHIPSENWIEKTLESFKPFDVGRYHIRGSHTQTPLPTSKISLIMDASTAFGTGEHQSTAGCLLALDDIAKRMDKKRILDVGCGTGILAIAAAHTFKQKALAVDIDPESVRVTKKYIDINKLNGKIHTYVSRGYCHKSVAHSAPYDLIFANILARPLCLMAKDAANHLEKGGHLILAGLLRSQKNKVLAAHRMQGLKLEKTIYLDTWCTLILRKP